MKKNVAMMPIPEGRDAIRLSPEQADGINWVKNGTGSAFLEAVAGSGKTFFLERACAHMEGRVAYCVFNKKNADEAKRKIQYPNVWVGTFHSAGYSALRRQMKPRVDATGKTRRMWEDNDVPDHLRVAVARMVSIGKQHVVGKLVQLEDDDYWNRVIDHFDILLRVDEDGTPEEEVREDLIERTIECVAWSDRMSRTMIDFDDMIWIPLVRDFPIYQNDWVLVDEAQDTNPARRLLAERMLKPGGRSVWVGDRHQAIYGFTGADNDAVDQIIKRFDCTSLPLSVTFRCSKAATELAQKWVPHITAHKNNAEGRVDRKDGFTFLDHHVCPPSNDRGEVLQPGDAILCRLTRPLVSLAFRLLRNNIACHVEGRDIGKNLERLATKWQVDTVPALITMLEAYRTKETDKYMARDAIYAVDALNDRVDTLIVLTEGCETVQDVVNRIQSMFKDTNGEDRRTVILSTVHKAKGREWDRVFILGYDVYMPSKWATQEWEVEQEQNIMYVAATRTKNVLVLTGALD